MMDEGSGFRGETPASLVYDDDPIEDILYGPSRESATEASIFGPARRFLEELRSGEDGLGLNAVLSKSGRFLDDGNPLTPELFTALFEAIVTSKGSEMLPATDETQEQLGRLLKSLWCHEVKRQLSPMMMLAGWTYLLWCGRRREIGEAKEVLNSFYAAAGVNHQEISKLANLQAEQLEAEGDNEGAERIYSMVRDFE